MVTALDGDRPHGTTVSAFASHSLTPPMVLVSLDNRSQLLAVIRRTGRFGLNILGVHQADLATAFARTGPDSSTGSPGRRVRVGGGRGEPVVLGTLPALQRFDGVRQPLVQGGTHLADCRSCRPPREGAGCGMARLLGPIRPLSPEDLERSEAIRRRPAPGRGAGHGPVLACSPP
ncbi:flavin reductase family protein [Streptomyces phaeochromogenes]|uniref:flavin reductase family protein n=1 Tax=Streptomyces phaeochromogenes TaxID=1923 RepID=UPI0027D77A53|nr:flavin reductase family protein [Streptomyces phaeochromogenes]